MGVLSWIFFGAIAGWAANVVVGGKDRRSQGCLVSVLTGVVGAALGGLGYQLITGQEVNFEFDFASLGIAILGAIVLVALIRLVTGRRH
ncbi:GlsB/YeaQ/YmgE family stress response membrane protein [Actinoalloteichus hymeniacidonis]|uniref:Membrane protein n=1 Tax=Actinoalloteichus hymeniacidonis TaxID=340345 RepID=A0AAC9HUB9_9PSEU|nr:GlsB/YeaQ/YmgE family stress response membrane protein [Actinoalloteichus hymeniacidonis]AOS65862.1 putative membrane protein [Actinoalloteichus hymeniacidonis]MBB5906044.1 putative membrane protein YeaQ/YmgE (transglycosylase-associated protein family) [Actinoalloteichus hymeniacidonis]